MKGKIINSIYIKRLLFYAALFFVSTFIFFMLRGLSFEGGDTSIYLCQSVSDWRIFWGGGSLIYNMREPLAVMLVQTVEAITDDPSLSFEIVSCASGGLWMILLYAFRRSWTFWLIMLCSSITFFYFGHKEFYAPEAVTLGLYFLLLTRVMEPDTRVRAWHVVSAWCLAVMIHRIALFFLPAMLPMFFGFSQHRLRSIPRREWEKVLGAVIVFALLDQVPCWIGLMGTTLIRFTQLDNNLLELLTLPKAWAEAVAARSVTGAFQLYYFGTLKHMQFFFGFWLLASPLAWWILIYKRFSCAKACVPLAIGAACGVLWALCWHPHMGINDWDLFAVPAVPVNIWAGILVSRPIRPICPTTFSR